MRRVMRLIFTMSTLGVITVGCSNNGNPVGPSQTQSSGVVQYTFNTPKSTYNSEDTLTATVSAHNSGSTADTIYVDYSYFEWALVDAGGDTVMSGGGGFPLGHYIPIQPGQSRGIDIYDIQQSLTGSSGTALPSGAYSLEATLQTWNNTVKSRIISFLLKLSVQ